MRTMKTAFATAALLTVLAGSALAHNHDIQDIVRDQRGAPVTSAVTGDCVYSTYQTTDVANPCTTGKAPVVDLADRTFFFGFDSAKLTPEATAKLDKIAALIMAAGNQHTAKVTGFADRVGSNSYNQKLSLRRADAVQKYLIAKGVSKTQVTEIKGVGETAPVTTCKGDAVTKKLVACLKPDRRVELTIE